MQMPTRDCQAGEDMFIDWCNPVEHGTTVLTSSCDTIGDYTYCSAEGPDLPTCTLSAGPYSSSMECVE